MKTALRCSDIPARHPDTTSLSSPLGGIDRRHEPWARQVLEATPWPVEDPPTFSAPLTGPRLPAADTVHHQGAVARRGRVLLGQCSYRPNLRPSPAHARHRWCSSSCCRCWSPLSSPNCPPGRIDTRALAVLGLLSALNAALRPLDVGTAGIEIVFFLLVLAGQIYGPGLGFHVVSASALLAVGVGPWLPFQMLAAFWAGPGAGPLLSRLGQRPGGRAEIAILVCHTVGTAYLRLLHGVRVLAVQPEPPTPSCPTSPGAPVLDNLHSHALHYCHLNLRLGHRPRADQRSPP